LLVVNVAAGKITTTIETDQNGSHMVALEHSERRRYGRIDVSLDQREVWATNRGSNTVSIIDVASSKNRRDSRLEVVPDPSEIHRRRQARARLERAGG
jgi:hypothetical protein